MSDGTSPASSGPSGSHFEGQVGAFYLLSLLVGAEPRGLPGTIIDRVAFQRASEGHPLDDIVVYGHDPSGKTALLEVQVKRGITFAPKDSVFESVVEQIAKVSPKPEFLNGRYELGIAISRTSNKIDGPYQDVLTWARQFGDATTFIDRINRPGSANDNMRAFISTFRMHLAKAGAPHDDVNIWQLLRRLQILVFDFTATASASEELARERAVRALHPEDALRAADLWANLTELAIRVASTGGERTREQLIEDLKQRSFRLAEDRQNLRAHLALAEATRNTLADIDDRVAGVALTRHERVTAVRDALDKGRYIEIRGSAGVGKSAVLKHFAEQMSGETKVIVLSPGRTVPKGWLAMRATLGFDGTARDLLSDLAANGSAVLFVDSLDFYGEAERLTVIDLVREAATIAGLSVIVTARRDFAVAERNWLPSEVLDKLGRVEPVFIDELSEAETEELRHAAPQLVLLLADNHPARAVARNLFRLSRLANRVSSAPVPRTEVEMAEQWWQTADGPKDAHQRERARVLTALAEQVLSRVERLTVKDLPAPAIDALVISETLRDLGNDHVTFRHDALRDWAIANSIFSNSALMERLPLDRPATPDLARGVELAARFAIERVSDAERWHSFLATLNKHGINASWARAPLLALVRSEIAAEMLEKASSYLLADRGQLLRELIRIVMAVESQPVTKLPTPAGVDPKLISTGINIPNGPSWLPLILWLLKLGHRLPPSVIIDVVDLYISWSITFGGNDPLTPRIVRWFHHWLMQIEPTDERIYREHQPQPFNGELISDQLQKLHGDLKMGFLAFCNHTPKLAADYLKSLRKRRYNREALRGIIKFRGALAQAAPTELADLTAEFLMSGKHHKESHEPFDRPFGFVDLDFVPASAAQGPFVDLLLHAPEQGLQLVRKLVDHAISWKSGGRDFGDNAIRISFPDGHEVVFPWYQSYGWSRDLGAGPSVVASALMALEAWAHRRIEAGDPFDKVLADVIGSPKPPAAYLLVVVDLLLSHWPKSRVAAVPFLGCPELLCLDQERFVADNIEFPDIMGVKNLNKEPSGLVSVDNLKSRPSRRHELSELLQQYTFDDDVANRNMLSELLTRAAARLGSAKKDSDLRDPEFMVVHALNIIDATNWQTKTIQTSQGLRP